MKDYFKESSTFKLIYRPFLCYQGYVLRYNRYPFTFLCLDMHALSHLSKTFNPKMRASHTIAHTYKDKSWKTWVCSVIAVTIAVAGATIATTITTTTNTNHHHRFGLNWRWIIPAWIYWVLWFFTLNISAGCLNVCLFACLTVQW